jgi:hypothetical protein
MMMLDVDHNKRLSSKEARKRASHESDKCHTLHFILHTSSVTPHTSHVTLHTLHVTCHTLRVTRHTLLITCFLQACDMLLLCLASRHKVDPPAPTTHFMHGR